MDSHEFDDFVRVMDGAPPSGGPRESPASNAFTPFSRAAERAGGYPRRATVPEHDEEEEEPRAPAPPPPGEDEEPRRGNLRGGRSPSRGAYDDDGVADTPTTASIEIPKENDGQRLILKDVPKDFEEFRRYENKAKAKVCAMCSDPDAVQAWFEEIHDRSVPFGALISMKGTVLRRLDAKLFAALQDALNGAHNVKFLDMIEGACEFGNGRQALRVISEGILQDGHRAACTAYAEMETLRAGSLAELEETLARFIWCRTRVKNFDPDHGLDLLRRLCKGIPEAQAVMSFYRLRQTSGPSDRVVDEVVGALREACADARYDKQGRRDKKHDEAHAAADPKGKGKKGKGRKGAESPGGGGKGYPGGRGSGGNDGGGKGAATFTIPECDHCGRRGHVKRDCWYKDVKKAEIEKVRAEKGKGKGKRVPIRPGANSPSRRPAAAPRTGARPKPPPMEEPRSTRPSARRSSATSRKRPTARIASHARRRLAARTVRGTPRRRARALRTGPVRRRRGMAPHLSSTSWPRRPRPPGSWTPERRGTFQAIPWRASTTSPRMRSAQLAGCVPPLGRGPRTRRSGAWRA